MSLNIHGRRRGIYVSDLDGIRLKTAVNTPSAQKYNFVFLKFSCYFLKMNSEKKIFNVFQETLLKFYL